LSTIFGPQAGASHGDKDVRALHFDLQFGVGHPQASPNSGKRPLFIAG
jgi:hypothetical protein